MTEVTEDVAKEMTALLATPGGKDGGINVEPVTPNDKGGNDVNQGQSQAALSVNIGGVEYVPASLVTEARQQVDELRAQVNQLVGNLDRMVTERSVSKLRSLLVQMEPEAPAQNPKADVQARMVEAARELERQVAAGKREGYTYADVASMAGGSHATAWKAINEQADQGEVFANLRARKYSKTKPDGGTHQYETSSTPVALCNPMGNAEVSIDVATPGVIPRKAPHPSAVAKTRRTKGIWEIKTDLQERVYLACCKLEAEFAAGKNVGYTINDLARESNVSRGAVWTYVSTSGQRGRFPLAGLMLQRSGNGTAIKPN